jgi:beta-galactosidase
MKYVKEGGNLVITLRTGVKDRNGHIFSSGWGEKIYPLIDATIDDFDQLLPNSKGTINSNGKEYYWNNWADLVQANKPENVIATYMDQFYAGKSAIVTNKIGKGSVTYIGVDTDDALLEKEVLKNLYNQLEISTENYPEGVYVQWRDGFWVAVNYSSKDYELEIPEKEKVLIGNKILKSGGVTIWTK